MRRYLVAVTASLFLLAGMLGASAAQSGSLDPTFSGDGIARNTTSSFSTVQIDAQDRVIVGGRDAKAGIVLRYKANGALDPTWKPYHLNPGYGAITGIAIVGTKTLVSTTGNGSKKAGYLIRLNADGRRDQTFGAEGVASGMGCWRCGLSDVGVATSGDIFASSTRGGFGESFARGYVVKVSPDGKVETGLGCPPDPSESCGSTNAIAVTPNYVYVAGDAWDEDYNEGAVVGRFTLNGTLDTSYGIDGYAWIMAGSNSTITATDVAVSPKTGVANVILSDCPRSTLVCTYSVARFTARGVPDPTFVGKVNFGHGVRNSIPSSITMQSGKVVVAGLDTACNNAAGSCFGIERLTSTGTSDTTFAGTGRVSTPGAPSSIGPGIRIFDQRIVLAGGQYIARYAG